MTVAQLTNTGASGLVLICSIAFIATYHLRAPWWRSAVGRHLMAVAAAIGALGLYTVLITVWPHGATASALRVSRTVILVLIAALMMQRTRMVVLAQRSARKTASRTE
jgi:hypothetical protein